MQKAVRKYLPFAATFVCGFYVADNKLAEALLVGGLCFFYMSEFCGTGKYCSHNHKPTVSVKTEQPVSKVVKEVVVEPEEEEEEEEEEEKAEQVIHPKVHLGPELMGQSKYRFDKQFELLPHQRAQVIITTPVDGSAAPAAATQFVVRAEARDRFFSTLASGGDLLPRRAPGLHTLDYLCASAK